MERAVPEAWGCRLGQRGLAARRHPRRAAGPAGLGGRAPSERADVAPRHRGAVDAPRTGAARGRHPESRPPLAVERRPGFEGDVAAVSPPSPGEAQVLGHFLGALHTAAPDGAPDDPDRNVPLAVRRQSIQASTRHGETPEDLVVRRAASHVVDAGAASPPAPASVGVHGDLHARNVLVEQRPARRRPGPGRHHRRRPRDGPGRGVVAVRPELTQGVLGVLRAGRRGDVASRPRLGGPPWGCRSRRPPSRAAQVCRIWQPASSPGRCSDESWHRNDRSAREPAVSRAAR